MLVVNLFGGPGSGKSTMAARVFSELKERGYNAELVTEYAKDLTWQESHKVLGNQVHIFGEQHHRLWRLKGGVDIVITDSPLMQGLLYCNPSDIFKEFVVEEVDKFHNIDIFLHRVKKYNPKGRNQSEADAIIMDSRTKELVKELGYSFDLEVAGWKDSTERIVKLIEDTYASHKE